MKILWFSWKDLKNPTAGGAERLTGEIIKRLVRDEHEVILVVAGFAGGAAEEEHDGLRIIRVGNRYTVYWQTYQYYRSSLRGWADLIVEEINTVPFLTKLYAPERKVLFFHQLCREIWFYQQHFPISHLGYWAEPFYLRWLNDLPALAASVNTRQDLLRYGFSSSKVHVVTQGNPLPRATALGSVNKYPQFTLLSLGALRTMKRVDHQVQAFEQAKEKITELQLKIAGRVEDAAGKKVLRRIKRSRYRESIEYLGWVTETQKLELMRKSHLILGTSVKEGWGVTITEAASQGTPAVVYDADGLRESVQHNRTGLVCSPTTPQTLAERIVQLYQDRELYQRLRQEAWKESKRFTYEQSYRDFVKALERI